MRVLKTIIPTIELQKVGFLRKGGVKTNRGEGFVAQSLLSEGCMEFWKLMSEGRGFEKKEKSRSIILF